jgi:hypothetical protein
LDFLRKNFRHRKNTNPYMDSKFKEFPDCYPNFFSFFDTNDQNHTNDF